MLPTWDDETVPLFGGDWIQSDGEKCAAFFTTRFTIDQYLLFDGLDFYYSGKKNMEHLENVISIDESVSSTTFIKIDVLWIHLFSQARYNIFNRF